MGSQSLLLFARWTEQSQKRIQKLWVIFLIKMLIRLNWLFQWLLLFLLMGESCLLLSNGPQCVHEKFSQAFSDKWYPQLSLFPSTLMRFFWGFCWVPEASHCASQLYWFLFVWPWAQCWWKEVCEMPGLHTVHGTMEGVGDTNSSLCPLYWSGPKATCAQYTQRF